MPRRRTTPSNRINSGPLEEIRTVASGSSTSAPTSKLQPPLQSSDTLAPEQLHQRISMRKSRLKILPARCLAQLGFLLLYLACPILGEMSRAQPDHGLASSLTLHVLEHCASPPKDPGDGSCSPMPEDTKMMTRNENGYATCSVASHLLNMATKCAPEDQPVSEHGPKVATVTLVPRRLLAARSKLPISAQEPLKTLPKRQVRHRSLKRDVDFKLKDFSEIADHNIVQSDRDVLGRFHNVFRRSVDERRNARTEISRTMSKIGSEYFRDVTSERQNSRSLNRDTFRSARSGDTYRTFQDESRRLKRASYSRANPSDIRNKIESLERSAESRRNSPAFNERRVHESRNDDRRSRYTNTRRLSTATLAERRMGPRSANYESRRFSPERTLVQAGFNERRSLALSALDSRGTRNSVRKSTEPSLLDARTMGIEARRSSRFSVSERRSASQDSGTVVTEQRRVLETRRQSDETRRSAPNRKLNERASSETRTRESRFSVSERRAESQDSGTVAREQRRVLETRRQSDETRRSAPNRKLNERASSETRTRESREMAFARRQSVTSRQRTSPDTLSTRSLFANREYRRLSGERLSLQRFSTERRFSESERRVPAEQRRAALRSASEGRISVSRASREDSRRHLLERRHSSLPVRDRYDASRRLLETSREQRRAFRSQHTLLRRLSDERTASRSRDGEISSRLIRDTNVISGTRRVRATTSVDRSDTNRHFNRARRDISMMNDGRHVFATATAQTSSVTNRRSMASRSLPVEIRMSETSHQQRINARRNMEESSLRVLRELSLSQARERMRASRERRIESSANLIRRARSLEERSAARKVFAMERQEARRTRDRELSVERISRARTSMERRDARRSVSERSARDRRFAFKASSGSLTLRREGERERTMSVRSIRDTPNSRRSADRENRRALSYRSTSRERVDERNLGRISRENDGILKFRRVDSTLITGRRSNTIRADTVRDSTRFLEERRLSRLSRRSSTETLISADRRNSRHDNALETTRVASRLSRHENAENRKYEDRSRLASVSRVASSRRARVTAVDSSRLLDASRRRMEPINSNARTLRLSLERDGIRSNYRTGSPSADRERRQSAWVRGRSSQRDDRFTRQLKALSSGQFLRQNVRAASNDAVRRQSVIRQNVLRELRTTLGNTYLSRRNSRSSEIREDRRHALPADRKTSFRDSRQSTERLMSAMQNRRETTDSTRMARSSKARNYAVDREQRGLWNYARSNRKSVSQNAQRYELIAFRKLAVNDNRLIVSKTDNSKAPEIIAENVTRKTDMVRDATVEEFNKHSTSWLKDLTDTFSMKWHTGALWQQVFFSLAALSWTKTGCIDTIAEKVSSYLFTPETMDIFASPKTGTLNDRDNLLGTVIGGGAAAAALLLFSTRTK